MATTALCGSRASQLAGLYQRVTAIVVTYNGLPYIGACLRSLMASSDPALEIVVVDNRSTDGTADFVQREFPNVRVVVTPANAGYGDATNRAAALSSREYIAVVNQDAVSTPGWIAALVERLEADPQAAIATPRILLADDPARINTCANRTHYTGITTCRGYNEPADAYPLQEEVAAVSGAAFVIRRQAFEAVGGFDAGYFLYFEDTDLSLRLGLAGYRCLYVPGAEIHHEFEPRFSAEKIFYLERNRLTTLLKLFRPGTYALLAPALALTEAAVLAYSLLRGPACGWAKLRAYGSLVARREAIRRARRRAQASRRVSDGALLGRLEPELELGELSQPAARLGQAALKPLFRAHHRLLRAVLQ